MTLTDSLTHFELQSFKAVFLDLDGTTLDENARVHPETAQALQSAANAGLHIIFSTGRPVESVRTLFGGLHHRDPVVSLSGAVIHTKLNGSILEQHFLPFDVCNEILSFLSKTEGLENLVLDEAEGFYALKHSAEIEEFIGMYGKKPRQYSFGDVLESPVVTMLIHARDQRRRIYDKLLDKFGDSIHYTFFKEYPWIELGSLTANKGEALHSVCRYLQLRPEECIAIGDGANDLEMIAAAGLGVAMGNADAEIRQVADLTIGSNRQLGVAEFLKELVTARQQ